MNPLEWYAIAGAIVVAWITAVFKFFYMPSTDHSLLEVPLTTPDMPPTPPVVAPDASPTPSSASIPFTPNPPFPAKIVAWANAVGKWEGAKPESNNPGNLKVSTLTRSWGATQGRPAADGGYFCQFLTPHTGFTALCNFLQLGAEGELIISHPQPCTLRDFTIRFAGNPPEGYIRGICTDLGVEEGVLISYFLT